MNRNSLIFAPLEGITNCNYREFILENYPEWDYLFTDFYRIPPTEKISKAKIVEHIGHRCLERPDFRDKTVFQLLANSNSNIEGTLSIVNELGLKWIDFNSGCPSKKVNAHHGGAWLMSEPKELKGILQRIRKNYDGFFSVKIRSGYKDVNNFEEVIKVIEGEGANLITVHPRTKIQMYEGISDWSYITKAMELTSLPIVGNGDVNTLEDYNKMHKLDPASIMIGRSAVASPDFARQIKTGTHRQNKKEIVLGYLSKLKEKDLDENVILKCCKNITNYVYKNRDDKTDLLRTKSLSEYERELSVKF